MGCFDRLNPNSDSEGSLIHDDALTHAYGVSRTFADVVIALNGKTPFKNAKDALSALQQYFQRFMDSGDEVAFTAIRTFWCVIRDPEVFADGKLDVGLLREKIFNFDNFCSDFDMAYTMHCKEKICNIIATINEFRQYTQPEQVIEDLDHIGLYQFSHCGPNEDYYILRPLNAGHGYPMYFFTQFLIDNWKKIAPRGVLEPKLLNEYMFDKHERGLRKYGLEAVIRHDYEQDGTCHTEVYFPKRIGSGPVYVETDDRKFIRSCGEGKGPNSIPNFLENVLALELIKEDRRYTRLGDYYIPLNDLSLPIYDAWMGKMDFNTVEEKRRFVDDITRRDSGC